MAAAASGRRSVPPGVRPIASVAVEKRRERPRPRRANLAPRPSTGSLTPHVLVSVSETGAPREGGGIERVVDSGPSEVLPARGTTLNAVSAGTISFACTRPFRRGMPTLRTGILRERRHVSRLPSLRSALRGLDTRLALPMDPGNYRSVGGVERRRRRARPALIADASTVLTG